MEEQPEYCWKDVGSIPTTSAVGWDGYDRFRTSSAIIFLKNRSHTAIKLFDYSRKGAASLVGWGIVCIFFIFSIDNELITVEKKIDFSKK